MKYRIFPTAAAILVATACSDASAPTEPDGIAAAPSLSRAPAARSAAQREVAGERIPGQYIVVLRDEVDDVPGAARRIAAAHGARITRVFSRAVKGFSVNVPDGAVNVLSRDPSVLYVEQDQVIRASGTQPGAPWGLDRIDQRALPINGLFGYTPTGAGVTLYIVDTGLRFDHAEFAGRATSGFDAIDGGTADDCNGHGTHVAGSAAGTTYGVAKSAEVVAVRVLGCDGAGTTSGVIAGVDWVAANHVKPAVTNLSLGGGASQALDDAVRRAVAAGVTFVAAAGNESADACGGSPARVPEALTVGATTSTDMRAGFSNYGSCVDLFAPGDGITSAWHTGPAATARLSGTSMAAPHAAGVAALYLEGDAAAAPASVAAAVATSATAGQGTGLGAGSPNRLLFAGLTAAPSPAPGAPCTLCAAYSGTLARAGATQVQPNGSYFYSAAGTHKGWLRGAAGTDFDLYLQRWNGYAWAYVAWAETASSEESFSYAGPAGYYRWVVQSYSGVGSYGFWLSRP